MPAGTKVDNIYQALKRKGMDKGKAARIAQSKSGEALATGKPPKHKGSHKTVGDGHKKDKMHTPEHYH